MANRNPTDPTRSWFEFVAAKGDTQPAEILIYDYIGAFGVTAKDFDAELKALGKQDKVALRINSPGGDTTIAASIYNMLERYKVKNSTEVMVVIDGIAASAASWIAMLGDDIVMPENALMMIHDPAGVVVGTSREMRSLATVLDHIKQGMVSAYVQKSGKDREEVAAIMEAETWYSAEEAVAEGFADRIDNPVEIAAALEGFDLSRFKNPPNISAVGGTPVSAKKEKVMTKTNSNAQETPAEMEARLRAEITAELTPAASAAPAATQAAAAQETPEQMQTRIRNEVQQTTAEIGSLCTIAGKPELAAGFIASGKTVAEVRTALEAAAKAPPANQQQGSPALNNHAGAAVAVDANKGLVAARIDNSKVWANYNKGKGTPVEVAA